MTTFLDKFCTMSQDITENGALDATVSQCFNDLSEVHGRLANFHLVMAGQLKALSQDVGHFTDALEMRFKRLEGLVGRVDQHDRRFDQLERPEGLGGRLDQLEHRFDQLEGRCDQRNRRLEEQIRRLLIE